MYRLLAAGAAVVTLAATAGAASALQGTPHSAAEAAGAPAAAAAAAALPPGHAWTVTLITGDVVGVRTVPGRPPLVTIRPGPGRRNVIFNEFTSSTGQIEVLPSDVAPLVGRELDPALFNVTALITNGDDNAHRDYIPLIVQGRPGTAPLKAARALIAHAQPGLALGSIDAVAVHEPKNTASYTRQNTGYIWLDREVHATAVNQEAAQPLDHNLVQIGAPAAWRKGDTGRGIKVAVLDTGIDATHPDLRGQIIAEKNFTTSPTIDDRFGHGTFVASQIAGTGAAADGARRGVAYGARLVIGKVLGDDGSGSESSVIAGMQWAAPQVKVISMSLGGPPSTGGTDPVTLAVNRLTAADHVLFVIAAGNYGPLDETVSVPGDASAALTVGAVDGNSRLALFSSRGPLPGSLAIKPEITAPGVNIVGARAAGTSMGSPVSALYTMASGTSMATPQVAGAAAILAALHPAWSPAEIKAALVSTAHAAYGGDEYEHGNGVLNIGTTASSTFVADQAIAGLGGAATTQRLSWTSTGKAPATIDLSAQLTDHAGHPVPRGVIGLAASHLTLAAGGTASTTLTVKPGPLAAHPGLYEGVVTAKTGTQTIRTPVSFYLLPPLRTLTLRATALPGTAAGNMAARATIIDATDPDLYQNSVSVPATGTTTVMVPAGHYWVAGEVDDTSTTAPRAALTGQPDVNLTTGNATVTLDGAKAVQATAAVTGHPTSVAQASIWTERALPGIVVGDGVYAFSAGSKVYGQPSGTAGTGTYRAYTGFRLTGSRSVYDLFHAVGDSIPASLAYDVTPAQQKTLARVNVRFYAVDGNTAPVTDNRYALTATGFLALQNFSQVAGGTTRTDYLSTEEGIMWNQEVSPPFTVAGKNDQGEWVIEIPQFRHYVPGSTQAADWAREPFRPGPYSGTQYTTSGCAPLPVTRSLGDIHVELVDLQDQPDGFDCLGGLFPLPDWAAATSRTMSLYEDHKLIGTSKTSVADFTVPQAAGSYQLTYTDNTSKALPVSTTTTTTWSFGSQAPSGTSAVRIPLLVIGYNLPLNLLNHPDGRTATLSVAPVAGTPRAAITGLHAWTSTDGGRTWQPATTASLGGGNFRMVLPAVKTGQAVSLRVGATDSAGGGIDQTIIAAYHG